MGIKINYMQVNIKINCIQVYISINCIKVDIKTNCIGNICSEFNVNIITNKMLCNYQ